MESKKDIRIKYHEQLKVRTGLKSGGCISDDDCRSGEVCRDDACRRRCYSDADCRPEQMCLNDYCKSWF